MKKQKNGQSIALWVLTIIFAVGGASMLKDFTISGILSILLGISCCPVIWELLSKQGIQIKMPVRVIISLGLFFAACTAMGAASENQKQEQPASSAIVETEASTAGSKTETQTEGVSQN